MARPGMRDLVTRPNWTYGDNAPPAAPAAPTGPSTALVDPKRPNFTMGDSPTSTAPRQAYDAEMPKPSMAQRMRSFAANVDASGAAQRAAAGQRFGAATGALRAVGDGYRDFTGAASQAVRSVANLPGAKVLLGGAGLAGAAAEGLNTVEAAQRGDTPEALRSGMNTLAGAATLVGGAPGAALGTAYGAGSLVGAGIDKGLQVADEKLGTGIRDKIGGYVNRWTNAFGGGVDPTATARADEFLASKPGAQPAAAAASGADDPTMPPILRASIEAEAQRNRPSFSDARFEANRPGPSTPTGNASGTFRYGNGSTGTGTVSSLSTIGVDGYQRQLANIRSLGSPDSTVGQGAGGIGFTPGGATGDRTGAVRSLMRSGLSARQADASLRADAQREQDGQIASMRETTARAGNSQALQIASMNNETSRANNIDSNNTSRANNEFSGAVSMRGQDSQLEANRASNALAAAQARRDQDNRVFERRRQATEDFDKWAGSVFVRQEGDKQVPDAAKVADFNNVAQQSLGNMITRLNQTGKAENIAKAEKLRNEGLAALDPEDRALLKTLYDRRDRFVQSRGIGPFSASGPVSNDLFDFGIAGRDNGLLQDRFKLAGGQEVPVNDLRYTEPANAILPDLMKTPTTALGPTMRERQEIR